jgi:hypothetical protein
MTEIFRKGDGDEKLGMMVAVVRASCKHAEGNRRLTFLVS